ncbi:MAG: mechanosensitive ion channel domain-containing protein [Waddliaceae bacterium]
MRQFILFIIFYAGALFGVLPDPLNLSREWWVEWSEVKEGESLKPWIDSLKNNLQNISAENLEEVTTLINEIETNLRNFQEVNNEPEKPLETTLSFSSSYTVNSFLRLKQQQRQQILEVQNSEFQFNELNKILAESQKILNQALSEYFTINEKTEKKLILGLRVINTRLKVENLKKRVSQLRQRVGVAKDKLALIKEEAQFAKDHLISSEAEVLSFERLADTKLEDWNEIQTKLRDFQSDPAAHDEVHRGELLHLRIDEMHAHLQALIAKSAYQLASLVFAPTQINHAELRNEVRKNQETISEITIELELLEEQLKRFERGLIDELRVNPEIEDERRQQIQEALEQASDNLIALGSNYSIIQQTNDILSLVRGINSRNIDGITGWLIVIWTQIKSAFESVISWLESPAFHVGEIPVTFVNILQFFATLILTFWLAKTIRRGIRGYIKGRKKIDEAVAYRFNLLLYYFILAAGIIIALTTLGIDTPNIFIMLSALGVGIGFGLQNIFKNFISGIIILFQSQLRVGDFVELESGVHGEIREISVLSTVIRTNDGSDVLTPNAEMINSRLTNWTYRSNYRRLRVPFSVSYHSDMDLVVKVVSDAAKDVPSTFQRPGVPDPQVRITEFGESGVEFELVVWVDGFPARHIRRTKSKYLWEIIRALKAAEISIPFPQREVRILNEEKD